MRGAVSSRYGPCCSVWRMRDMPVSHHTLIRPVWPPINEGSFAPSNEPVALTLLRPGLPFIPPTLRGRARLAGGGVCAREETPAAAASVNHFAACAKIGRAHV